MAAPPEFPTDPYRTNCSLSARYRSSPASTSRQKYAPLGAARRAPRVAVVDDRDRDVGGQQLQARSAVRLTVKGHPQ
jgi:hypothetical protein